MYQLSALRWQFQWVGPRLQNQRFLVCDSCYDIPQENIRTIVVPPDPIPVFNPRPENYVQDDNPLSPLGASENPFTPQYGSRIGNLTGNGGLNAAFDGRVYKPSWQAATNGSVSNSSFNNYIGINWQGFTASLPSSIAPPVVQHTLSSVTVYAPTNVTFLDSTATNYLIQFSSTGGSAFSEWTTIASGTTAGTAGESFTVTITSTMTNTASQYHRVAIQGNGTNYISVAQVQFSVAETGAAVVA